MPTISLLPIPPPPSMPSATLPKPLVMVNPEMTTFPLVKGEPAM